MNGISKNAFSQVPNSLEPVFLGIYVLEIIIKVITLGFFRKKYTPTTEAESRKLHPALSKLPGGYFLDGWNCFDFVVVILSFLAFSQGRSVSFLRLVRIFRPLRAVSHWKSLRLIVNTMLHSLVAVANIVAFMLSLVLVFGVLGVRLFQGVLRRRCFNDGITLLRAENRICSFDGGNGLFKCPSESTCLPDAGNPNFGLQSFDNFYMSAFQVFQTMLGEGNFDILYNIQDGYSPHAWMFTVFIFVLLTIVSLNILLAAIEDSFKRSRDANDSSYLSLSADMDKEERIKYLDTLKAGINWLEVRTRKLTDKINDKLKNPNVLPYIEKVKDNELPITERVFASDLQSIRNFCRLAQNRLISFEGGYEEKKDHKAVGLKVLVDGKNKHEAKLRPKQELKLKADPEVDPEAQVQWSPSSEVAGDEISDVDTLSDDDDQVDRGASNRESVLSKADEDCSIEEHQTLLKLYVKKTQDASAKAQRNVLAVLARKHKKTVKAANAAYIVQLQRTLKLGHYAVKGYQEFRTKYKEACQKMDLMVRAVTRAYKSDYLKKKYLQNKPKWVLKLNEMVASKYFEAASLLVIVINSIFQSLDRHQISRDESQAIQVVNSICVWIFFCECLARYVGQGHALYFRDVYNVADSLLVTAAVIDETIVQALGNKKRLQWLLALRSLRIFRLSRGTYFLRGLRVLTNVLVQASGAVGAIFLVTLVILFLFAVLGVQLFGTSFARLDTRWSFADTYQSFLVVFMAVTGDSWPDAAAQAKFLTNDWAPLYFCVVIIVGDFIITNLFIAVLLAGFDDDEGGLMELESLTVRATAHVHEAPGVVIDVLGKHIDEVEMNKFHEAKSVRDLNRTKLDLTTRRRNRSLIEGKGVRAKAKRASRTLISSDSLRNLVCLIVIIDCAVVALQASDYNDPSLKDFQAFAVTVYSLEVILKITAFGAKTFFKHWDHCVDVALIIISLFGFAYPESRVINSLYAFRSIRILTRFSRTKVILEATCAVIPKIMSSLLLIFIIIFSFALLLVSVFKGTFFQCNDLSIELESECIGVFILDNGEAVTRQWQKIHFVRNFDNIGNGLITLFQVSTLSSWNLVMYSCIDAVSIGRAPERNHSPEWGIVFFVFVILAAFIAFNVFVAVLVNKFHEQKQLRDGSALLTPAQKGWVDAQKYVLDLMELPHRTRDMQKKHFIRRACYYIVGEPEDFSSPFAVFILGMILFNAIFLCLDHYQANEDVRSALTIAEYFFTIIFTIEMLLKVGAWGWKVYIRDPWDRFDALIVVVSLIGLALEPLQSLALIFRTFRLFRVFMLVRKLPILSQFSQVFVLSLPSMLDAMVIVFVTIFIYAVIATVLFKKVAFWDDGLSIRANFRTWPNSMLSLFRVMVGDAWEELMYGCMITEETGACSEAEGTCGFWWASLFFISYVLVVQVMLIGLTLATMMDAFNQYLERDRLYLTLEKWRQLWSEKDPKGHGILPAQEVLKIIEQAPKPLGLGEEKTINVKHKLAALKRLNLKLTKISLSEHRYRKLHHDKPPRKYHLKKRGSSKIMDSQSRPLDQVSSIDSMNNPLNLRLRQDSKSSFISIANTSPPSYQRKQSYQEGKAKNMDLNRRETSSRIYFGSITQDRSIIEEESKETNIHHGDTKLHHPDKGNSKFSKAWSLRWDSFRKTAFGASEQAWVVKYHDLMVRLVDLYYAVDYDEIKENPTMFAAVEDHQERLENYDSHSSMSDMKSGKCDLVVWYSVHLISAAFFKTLIKNKSGGKPGEFSLNGSTLPATLNRSLIEGGNTSSRQNVDPNSPLRNDSLIAVKSVRHAHHTRGASTAENLASGGKATATRVNPVFLLPVTRSGGVDDA